MRLQLRSKAMSPWLLVLSLLMVASVLAVAVVARKRLDGNEVDR